MTQLEATRSGPAAALEDAAAEFEEVAWREGIDRDGLLAPLVMALRKVLVRIAEVQARHELVVTANIEAARQLSASEGRQLKEMLHAASVAVQQARSAEIQLEIQRKTVVAGLVQHLGPQLSEGIKHWQVIKEREVHRRAARLRAAVTALAAVGLLVAGYGARTWQDRDATTALKRCVANPLTDPGTGRASCALNELLPR